MGQEPEKINKGQFWIIAALIAGGSFCSSLTMIRSGLIYEFGRGFWGANGHDGIWHLSLINQVLKGMPPPNPVFAGHLLTNYHFFYDWLLALISQLTHLSPLRLYFQVFPVLIALSLGVLSFLVGLFWQKSFWVGFWLAFFNYFAGSFGFLVTLFREGKLGGESLFWSMQSISSLINPPFAFSLVIFLIGMFLLLRISKWRFWQVVGTGVLFGLLINIKAYGGLVALVALGGFVLAESLQGRKKPLLIFSVAFAISAVVLLIINRPSASLFVFKPLWFVHTMIESPDRLYWPKLALARYSLLIQRPGPRLVLVEILGGVLFLIGNLGSRIIGLWGGIKVFRKEKSSSFDWFLLAGMAAGLLPALLFIQRGTAWNTIQFFYYFLFFANFFAALATARLVSLFPKLAPFLLFFLLVLTLPGTAATLKDYWGYPAPAALPSFEEEALGFLGRQPQGVVLTYPYDKYKKSGLGAPLPLYLYETTAYVSAFSGQVVFLEDEMNLEITGYPWQERRRKIEEFFTSQDKIWARGLLVNNRIDYIYLVNDQSLSFRPNDLGLKVIFDNGQVRIYQVLK